MKPLCIDLYCGLGGWTEGALAEGYDCVGFDIERHCYGDARYPAQLVLQDVLTLHGSQFRDAALIVASPPCQAYSSRGMPWNALLDSITPAMCQWGDDGGPVNGFLPLAPIDNSLFRACFRLQREASEAAGRYISLIVENVNRAQRWVGPARWHSGSYYLWGDVPAIMPFTQNGRMKSRIPAIGKRFDARIAKTVEEAAALHYRLPEGFKQHGSGAAWFDKALDERRKAASGTKAGGDWFGAYADEKAAGTISPGRLYGKRSDARKAASAQIARIPFELARWIAYCFKPR